jgi:hypothetical protein
MNAKMTPLCDTQSPAASDGSELESRRDVPHPETKGPAAGGPAHYTPQQDATPGEGSVGDDGILTLTAAEREAVEWYSAYGAGEHAATLRSLLQRLE